MKRALIPILCAAGCAAASNYPAPSEGVWAAKQFRFSTCEILPKLRIQYFTLGSPKHDANGTTTNAVLILHGTGGSGRGFLSERFAGELFGAGQLLDAARYFIILPDAIGYGHFRSPSDGLHMRFPKFTYDDMVRAQYGLVTDVPQLELRQMIIDCIRATPSGRTGNIRRRGCGAPRTFCTS